MSNASMPKDANGGSMQILSPAVSQTVAISGTSAQSAAFTTNVIRFTPSVSCFFLVGANPTALTTSHYAAAGSTYPEIPVPPGHKIAFITSGATGSVYISELL